MIYIVLAIVIVLAVIYGFSIYAFNQITLGKRYTIDECLGFMEKDKLYSKKQYENLKKEEVRIKSQDGLSLRGIYVEKYKESKKVIIIVHGYTVSHTWAIQFADMFLKEGFNVLLIDQRSHGGSEGKYATYGYYEKYDLDLWVEWVRSRAGEDAVIGLHGQSMGGGTVLEYAGINKYVKFIIADCPYSNAVKLIKYQFKMNHFPIYPFIYFVNFRLKLKAKFSLKDVSPINSMKDKDIPIMFIHGSKDNFVPTIMSEEMYKAKRGFKKLLIIEGAVHANAYNVNKQLYEREVHNFLEEIFNRGVSTMS